MLIDTLKLRLAKVNQDLQTNSARYQATENQLKQLLATCNSLLGAKTEVENLIKMMEEPKKPEVEDEPKGEEENDDIS